MAKSIYWIEADFWEQQIKAYVQHFSKIHTTRLETVYASALVAVTRRRSRDVGRSPNEQVWTGLRDHHQMSPVGGRVGSQVWCPGGGG